MKFTALSLASLSLLQLAVAQPHGHHHAHERRDTEILVYVDAAGKPVSTVTTQVANPTPAPAAPAVFAAPSAAPPAASSAPAPAGAGNGITYSALGDNGKGCRDVNGDFAKMTGYGIVRVYDTACLPQILSAAKATSKKVFLGLLDLSDVAGGCKLIIDTFKADWAMVHTISIGNEVVQAGGSPGAVVTAVGTARGILSGAGYTGPVISVDTLWMVLAHPELCTASDYVGVNAHAFFDTGSYGASADTAAKFIHDQMLRVKTACGNKKVVITETGWPSSGQSHDNAVPSKENQQKVVTTMKAAFSDDPSGVFFFSAFNEPWKGSGQYGVESFWGIL